jgi:hypothetical protein
MAALLLLGLAGFFLLALWTHSPADPQGLVAIFQAAGVHNAAGKAGALVAAYLISGLGLAAFILPLMFLGLAWQSHHQGLEDLGWLQTLSGLGVLLASAGLLSLAWPAINWGGDMMYGGGGLGKRIAGGLRALLNPAGAALGLALVWLVSVMGATRLSYVGLMAFLGQALKSAWGRGRQEEELPEAPPYHPRRPTVGRQVVTQTEGEPEVPVLTPAVATATAPAPEAAGMSNPAARHRYRAAPPPCPASLVIRSISETPA